MPTSGGVTVTGLRAGEHEGLKLGVHAALGSLAALCTLYNLCAFGVRRERHLFYNVVIYGTLTALEARQVDRHARRSDPPR